jgi:O-acetyl-ADP-ribose deacetylase (regulator of RNase III)
MSATFGETRVALILGDITTQEVDAIVNAANSGLMGGGGVDGAIHGAGGPQILEACKKIRDSHGPLPAGHAVVTTGGRLPARRVIHTVGPVWNDGKSGEAYTLANAYRSCLDLARAEGLRTVAFPSISTGAYGYPVDLAAGVALSTVRTELEAHLASLDEVRFVLFNRETYDAYRAALDSVSAESNM